VFVCHSTPIGVCPVVHLTGINEGRITKVTDMTTKSTRKSLRDPIMRATCQRRQPRKRNVLPPASALLQADDPSLASAAPGGSLEQSLFGVYYA